MLGRENIGELRAMPTRRQSMAVGDYPQVNIPQGNVDHWAHELSALRETLARRSDKTSGECNPASSEYEGFYSRGWLRLKR
jgi:hypothetical protein